MARGRGCVLQYSTNGTVWTDVAKVRDIDGLGINSVGERDLTTLDSEAKEYGAGMPDGGTATVKLRFERKQASQQQLLAWCQSPSTLTISATINSTAYIADEGSVWFRVTMAETSTEWWQFMAVPKKFRNTGFNPDGTIDADVELRIDGKVWFPTTV